MRNLAPRHRRIVRSAMPALLGVAAILIAACGKAPAPVAPRDRPALPQPRLGTNVRDVTHWSAEWVFVDCFRQSSPAWVSNDATPIALRPDDYPARLAPEQTARVMLQRSRGRYPRGRYLCTCAGTGRLRISGDATKEIAITGGGRFSFDVAEPKNGFDVEIVETDPRDPVRAIRVFLPGFDAESPPFHPLFIERMAIYDVVRFMDTQQTNDSPTVTWNDRKRPDARTQTGASGVALEHLVDIANAAGKHPWFCIPHAADDDYVRRFAELVRERLANGLRCYVEYSNECWNGMFRQQAWCRDRGRALGLAPDDAAATHRYYSERAVAIFAIFRDVFGDRPGLQCVLSAQASNPNAARAILTWKDAYRVADLLGIAPYLGGRLGLEDRHATTRTASLDDIFSHLRDDLGEVRSAVRSHAGIAARYGLQLVAYEGGQHLFQLGGPRRDDAITERFIAANRDPRMEAIYRDYLACWRDAGGSLFCHYLNVCHSSTWGSWGALEWQGQDPTTAPKYRALSRFASER